jgi:site-specific recombinase
MTLKSWYENRWLVEHETSSEEIAELFGVVDRDLKDAKVQAVSPDWRLAIAYNAALQLATIALAAEGYKPEKLRAHERTIESLRHTIGLDRKTVDVIDAVRRKRNRSSYEHAGAASDGEVNELLRIAADLRRKIADWVNKEHPELIE